MPTLEQHVQQTAGQSRPVLIAAVACVQSIYVHSTVTGLLPSITLMPGM